MKEYLIVVDVQGDFIDGPLGTAEARAALPAICRRVAEFEGEILFTRDTHGEDYMQTQEGRQVPTVHCRRGTAGWQIHPSLAAAAAASTVVDKSTFASFPLALTLRERDACEPIGRLTLIGLCTDVCVISHAILLRAALPGCEILVDAACCAGVSPASHRTALAAMRACGIRVENG